MFVSVFLSRLFSSVSFLDLIVFTTTREQYRSISQVTANLLLAAALSDVTLAYAFTASHLRIKLHSILSTATIGISTAPTHSPL